MVLLDYIGIGSAVLFGTGRERKIQNENFVSNGIRIYATSRQVFYPYRLLHHDGLKMSCGLIPYSKMGYKLIKP